MEYENNYMEEICHAYFYAKKFVIKKGFSQEIDWQQEINFKNVTEQDFLRETAWVILSSGMREKIIEKIFPKLSNAFYDWSSAKKISNYRSKCYKKSFLVFSHEKKILAILKAADIILEKGFSNFKNDISTNGIQRLEIIPYIGPITKFHLAKNIGLDISKPDRHLNRISNGLGFKCPQTLCRSIANKIDEKKSVVDIVIWRYATLNNNYLETIEYFLEKKPFKNILKHGE